jgi:hypothetical protein
MNRAAAPVLAVLIATLLAAGCGGSGSSSSSTAPGGAGESTAPKKATSPNAPAGSKVVACGGSGQLRAAAVGCHTARTTMERWESSSSCALPEDASRNSCRVGGFRCQATNAGAGASVSCVGPKGDVAFIARPAG